MFFGDVAKLFFWGEVFELFFWRGIYGIFSVFVVLVPGVRV